MSCSVCKKYNLTEEQYKQMVRDGVISTTYPHYDAIYETFKTQMTCSAGTEDAVIKTSIQEKCSRETVYRVIAKFK